ncbi:MAG TPA: cyclodeaminase/cyclohydrolase family protein, partial [Candidatus Tumulicola sp.]|nr:cyclodeaminase/cyclohydrolase family protein [Candidatus Tumulicola sp.]
MQTFDEYVHQLASSAPVPGGGSAAAIVAAAGAALVGMVARICAGNPKYAAHAALAQRLSAESDRLVAALKEARDRDERAFGAVVSAQALPKATPQERASRTSAL